MQLKNKKILIISPEHWNHIFVSKHHYALQLAAEGNEVIFLNPPQKKKAIKPSGYKNLRIVDYKGFLTGLRFFPKFMRKFITRNTYNQLTQTAGFCFDIIWSFDNSVFFDFDALPGELICISHIMDLNQNFQTQRAAQSATICFGVIPKIVERLKRYNPNSYLIRHGVGSIPEKKDSTILPGINSTKALYIGNLAMPHLDWELLIRAAEKFNQVDFVCLGSNQNVPIVKYKNLFSRLQNIYFINAVASDELPNYLISADILLLFYTSEYYKNYASPHKMMEYLASGKPIVASYTDDYSEYSDLIHMGHDQEEWLEKFDFVNSNLTACSTNDKHLSRLKIAHNNTYQKQISRIASYLTEIIPR